MRRVYFFLPDFPEWTTGGHKYHTILYEYFKKKNKNTYSFGYNRYVKYVETNKFLKIIFGIFYSIKIPKRTVIILSNSSFLHCFIPVFFNKIWKHHYYFLIIHHLVRDEKPSFLRKKLEDYFIRKADKIVTVSKTTQKRLYDLNLGLKNIEIVNPGLDVDKLPDNYKKRFPDKLKFLFIGTLEERKGLIYLIEALSLLNEKDFELNVIGETSNSTEYLNLIKDKIKSKNLTEKINFIGKVDRKELKSYFLNSSIFLFPSLWEGYGMVVAEAMAYGLPVIASKIPAITELIDHNVNGILVDVKRPELIFEKINILLSEIGLSEKISNNAILKSKKFPDWNQISERIYKIVNEI